LNGFQALEDYMAAHEKVGGSVDIRAKIALIHDRFGITSFNKGWTSFHELLPVQVGVVEYVNTTRV
jgi:hypothetical protein